jgi:hypothetical protein
MKDGGPLVFSGLESQKYRHSPRSQLSIRACNMFENCSNICTPGVGGASRPGLACRRLPLVDIPSSFNLNAFFLRVQSVVRTPEGVDSALTVSSAWIPTACEKDLSSSSSRSSSPPSSCLGRSDSVELMAEPVLLPEGAVSSTNSRDARVR